MCPITTSNYHMDCVSNYHSSLQDCVSNYHPSNYHPRTVCPITTPLLPITTPSNYHSITTQTIGIVKQAQPGTPVPCISALFKLFGKTKVVELAAEQGLDVLIVAQANGLFEQLLALVHADMTYQPLHYG